MKKFAKAMVVGGITLGTVLGFINPNTVPKVIPPTTIAFANFFIMDHSSYRIIMNFHL